MGDEALTTRSWWRLTRAARWVLGSIIGAGLVVVGLQLPQVTSDSLQGVALFFIAMALATGSITLSLPHTRTSFSLDTVFVLALLLSGHLQIAVVVAGASMAIGELRSGEGARRPWHTVPTNFAIGALSAQASVLALSLQPAGGPGIGLASAALLVALGSYVTNVALVALVVAVTRGAPVLQVLRGLATTYPAFIGAGSLAALLSLAVEVAPLLALLATPLLVVLYVSVHAWREKVLADERHERDIELMYLPTVAAIASAIEARNAADGGHHKRVQSLSLALAEEMKIEDAAVLRAVRFGALMHDLGRLALPDSLLLKTGPLNPVERRQLEMHPVLGAELIRHIPFDAPVAETIRYHHEQWDGGGYPEGLVGEAIPLPARLVAVAEAVDTMMSKTHYSRAMSAAEMLADVASHSGTRYDPAVAAALPAAIERSAIRWIEVGAETSAAFSAIAEGAVSQGLELRLSDALRAARNATEVLEALSSVTPSVLPVDGWALVQDSGVRDSEALACGDDMDALLSAARNDPALFDGAHLRADLDEVQALAPCEKRRALALKLTAGKSWRGAVIFRLKSGASGELLARALARAIARPTADTLARIWRAEQGERQASTDLLTGLGNGLAFERAIAAIHAHDSEARVALLALDLDGFKGINDHFGHHVGDLALERVGQRLTEVDSIGLTRSFRKGGDEFVILVDDAEAAIADRLAATIRQRLECIELQVTADEFLFLRTSVGTCCGTPDASGSVDHLLQRADAKMYEDKQARPDRLPRGARPETHRHDPTAATG